MRATHYSKVFCFAGSIAVMGMSANAAHTTHPGYSAKGGTLAATQWNLICDPANVISGSMTTNYSQDLTQATLNSVTAEPGFEITDVQVEVNGDGTFVLDYPQNVGTTFVSLTGISHETGFIQVSFQPFQNPNFQSTGFASPLLTADTNTHIVTFDSLPGNTIATFTNMGDPGQANGGHFSSADQYTVDNGDGTTTTYSADPTSLNYPQPRTVYSDGFVGQGGIAPETASVTLLPEPASAGVLMVGGIVAAGLRRRRTR